ncbi:hypothetical protein TRFO_08640 [Tritrichomonas foetus]|uniref:RRM domain-containing protein n=1 Tax=Tritrichomonas foetus TaxID=1144522 RepID=A0A1J4JP71_9EUKA|nr:hypothetical protein TRFO_08640 [Tritrichomonas foetus]|eukprot:OHS99068.1 hypothetical protein TRFO_08640 [Tritrichomonas foetus]
MQQSHSIPFSYEERFRSHATQTKDQQKWLIIAFLPNSQSVSPLIDPPLQSTLNDYFLSIHISLDDQFGKWVCDNFHFPDNTPSIAIMDPGKLVTMAQKISILNSSMLLTWIQSFIGENGRYVNHSMIKFRLKFPGRNPTEPSAMKRNGNLYEVFRKIAQQLSIQCSIYRFYYKGRMITENDTPDTIGLVPLDYIEARNVISTNVKFDPGVGTNLNSNSTSNPNGSPSNSGFGYNPVDAKPDFSSLKEKLSEATPSTLINSTSISTPNQFQQLDQKIPASPVHSDLVKTEEKTPEKLVEKLNIKFNDPKGNQSKSHIKKDRKLRPWILSKISKTYSINELLFYVNDNTEPLDIEKTPDQLHLEPGDIINARMKTNTDSSTPLSSQQMQACQSAKETKVEIVMKMESQKNLKLQMPSTFTFGQAFEEYAKKIKEKRENLRFILINSATGEEMLVSPNMRPSDYSIGEHGTVVEVYKKIIPREETNAVEIMVRDIPFSAREKEIKKLFKKWGDIVSFHILRDPYCEMLSVAFLTFESDQDGYKCFHECKTNPIEYSGRTLLVSIAKGDQ